MIFPVVRALAADRIPVAVTCRVLRLAPAGYYDWVGRPLTGRDLEDAYLLNEIVDIHRASRGTYGAPRVHAELKLGGWRVSAAGCSRTRSDGRRTAPRCGFANRAGCLRRCPSRMRRSCWRAFAPGGTERS